MKKRHYPFRIGSTSYIIPADILTNVNHVARYIDDIELVLFETPGESNLPSHIDTKLLADIALQKDVTFTIHLPTDKKVELHNILACNDYVNSLCKTIDICSTLSPYAYVLHFEGIHCENSESEIVIWQDACRASLELILEKTGVSPKLVCIENLAYPWQWYAPIADEFGTSYCLDIGHLWATAQYNWLEQANILIDNARVIHLHGLCVLGDHCSLAKSDAVQLECFIDLVKKKEYSHIITIEVFNETDLTESLDCVRNVWGKLS